MAINLYITIARGDDNRLKGIVRVRDAQQVHTFSGTLELLRVFEDLLAADPSRASSPSGRRWPASPYDGCVSEQTVLGGVVHELPADLRHALIANAAALDAWQDITPLARNEFICWVEDAKQQSTRERRIRRTQQELEEGQRRPCCWPGCRHRERTGR